jgi:hypothetical protein
MKPIGAPTTVRCKEILIQSAAGLLTLMQEEPGTWVFADCGNNRVWIGGDHVETMRPDVLSDARPMATITGCPSRNGYCVAIHIVLTVSIHFVSEHEWRAVSLGSFSRSLR